MTINRQSLIDLYLEWINDYITIQKFAEHKELHTDEAWDLIQLAKRVFEGTHPEA